MSKAVDRQGILPRGIMYHPRVPRASDTRTLFPFHLILFVVAAILFPSSCALKPPPFDEAEWRARVRSTDPSLLYAPHYREGRFFNPWMPGEEKGLLGLIRWRLTSEKEYTEEERRFAPEFIGNGKERIVSGPEGDFIMWVGHGTFLIRLNGEYWLTDPMFSERALVPKRKVPPGITIQAIKEIAPRINIIISHNHHDHLDRQSMMGFPENARVYVPLGLKTCVQGMKKSDVHEMDWWQGMDCGNGTTLVCLPMQHWSRRIGQGYNETLWASFLLITPSTKIYFGGDTGYFIGHREIGKRYPGIDYALLPTTAYHPRWFMHYAHMDVDEALEAMGDLNARFMIPHQWGTFHLGDEPVGYSIVELKRKVAERNLDHSRFIVLNVGEIHYLPQKPS